MFDTLKMIAYKTKQFFCNHNYIKTRYKCTCRGL